MSLSLRLKPGMAAVAITLGAGIASVAILGPTINQAMAQGSTAVEKPVAKEVNPPGDIPDSQVFVEYTSPLGIKLKVPEGWARTDTADGASFADKYGQIVVGVKPSTAPHTAVSVRLNEATEMEKAGRAVKISAITDVKLPAGPAVRVVYTSNSEPNSVTNKQIRLENERFIIDHNDKTATLTFSAPAGADNVDQWTLMSKSFGWR